MKTLNLQRMIVEYTYVSTNIKYVLIKKNEETKFEIIHLHSDNDTNDRGRRDIIGKYGPQTHNVVHAEIFLILIFIHLAHFQSHRAFLHPILA